MQVEPEIDMRHALVCMMPRLPPPDQGETKWQNNSKIQYTHIFKAKASRASLFISSHFLKLQNLLRNYKPPASGTIEIYITHSFIVINVTHKHGSQSMGRTNFWPLMEDLSSKSPACLVCCLAYSSHTCNTTPPPVQILRYPVVDWAQKARKITHNAVLVDCSYNMNFFHT
jgi:hypothetical protein